MMSKLVILAACLLSVAAAQVTLFGAEEEPQASRFIRAELLSLGAGPTSGEPEEFLIPNTRLLHIGVEFSKIRLGLALLDFVGCPVTCVFPVTAGYTMYERPVHCAGSLHAKVPEVYVEAMGSFINGDPMYSYWGYAIPFKGTLELVGSFDGPGVGGSLAVGLCRVATTAHWIEPLSLYAAARLHLLRFRWGF